MDLPKRIKANKIGRNGVTILAKIIEDKLDWLLRINHQEDDFGIDGFIDIISDEGQLTGKSIAMQIKSGESYFRNKTNVGWRYYGENRHLNYYLNHDIPVLIVIVNIDSEKAFWTLCDPGQTEKHGNGWSITIPFENELTDESKEDLKTFISPIIDYISQLEEYWETNKILKSIKRILFIVVKEDIEKHNYSPLINALQRIGENKELIYAHKENIEIAINGYDSDSRELFEIPEVRDWINNILENVKGLAFFLVNKESAKFLKVISYCNIDVKVVERGRFMDGRLQNKIEYDSADMKPILVALFEDLNSFCYLNKIPTEIIREISTNIVDCFTNGDFSRSGNNNAE